MRFSIRAACASVAIVLLAAQALPASARSASSPDAAPAAITPDGGRYYGPLVNGKLHGEGRLEWANGIRYEGGFKDGLFSGKGKMSWPNGERYQGEFSEGFMSGQGRLDHPDSTYTGSFRQDYFWGKGRLAYKDGRAYAGEFVRGRFHGKGRFRSADGDIYEGRFIKDEPAGKIRYTRSDGGVYEGAMRNWQPHGAGTYTAKNGDVYRGIFVDGDLAGAGSMTMRNGDRYEGEFRNWRFHGKGVYRHANGDEYKGSFAHGLYEGEGTLTYATPRPDGRSADSGTWRYGELENKGAARRMQDNVEQALYGQRALLDRTLAALAPQDPGKIDMYLLAVGGDGAQEVFRREVDFVRSQFDRDFGTGGRSLALVNSRSTASSAPMATVTSLRESLNAIAGRMDKENDILFLFLTSHGSQQHAFSLDQNGMELRDLPAAELGAMLKQTGIRWKVVVVSACYSGGFIDPIKDDHTLVITAARHDRTSFGCADENDFTYFGRAFFKEALPSSDSFPEAFRKASALVAEWEARESGAGKDKKGGPSDAEQSLPQMHDPEPVKTHLQRWRAQLPAAARRN